MSNVRGVIADTCFWIAAFDAQEDYHSQAAKALDSLQNKCIIMPWPIMYEVLRTRTARNPNMTQKFHRVLRYQKLIRVDDVDYRDQCLIDSENAYVNKARCFSLVDRIIRAVMLDKKYLVTQLLTFNRSDFQDICNNRNVSIWPT